MTLNWLNFEGMAYAMYKCESIALSKVMEYRYDLRSKIKRTTNSFIRTMALRLEIKNLVQGAFLVRTVYGGTESGYKWN